jgi:putative solute:sodium symporter small subunit
MTDKDTHDSTADERVPDGGLTEAARDHRQTDYLDREVNLLSPSTPYMRDHLRIVWAGFIAWALIVFGPVTLTAIAPGVMTTTMPALGFPWHYFLVAFGAPTGALILAAVYARQRDKLDEKYGIDHSGQPTDEPAGKEPTVADGGESSATRRDRGSDGGVDR